FTATAVVVILHAANPVYKKTLAKDSVVSQLTQRFQIVQNLRVAKNEKVFIADDFVLERSNVVVRVFRRGLFNSDRELPYRFFSWHQGIVHPHLARILDAGVS